MNIDPRSGSDYDYNQDDDEGDFLDAGIEIHSEAFDKDFDEIGFDPEIDDDSDADAAEMFDY